MLLVDKNLGPIVVNRKDYLKHVMTRHLLNDSAHEPSTKIRAQKYLSSLENEFTHYSGERGNKM